MSFYPPPLSSQPPVAKSLLDLGSGTSRCPDTVDIDHAQWVYAGLASNEGCIPTSRDAYTGVEVLVIGGGLSGLAAAWELIRSGINVTLVDGSQRCDDVNPMGAQGRVYTRHLRDPADSEREFNCEMGAMGFPVESKLFWVYASFLYQMLHLEHLPDGVRNPIVQPFPSAGTVPTAVMLDGKLHTLETITSQSGPLPYELMLASRKVNAFFSALVVTDAQGVTTRFDDVQRILKQNAPVPPDLDRVAFFWSTMIDRYDSRSLEDVLRATTADGGACLSPDELRIYAAIGEGVGGFAPMLPLGFLATLRIRIWNPGALMQPPPGLTASGITALLRLACDKANVNRGNSTVWGALAFHENTTATSVLWNSQALAYDVTTMDVDGVVSEHSFKYVVVATSPLAFQARLDLDRRSSTAGDTQRGVFQTVPNMLPRVSAHLKDIVRATGNVRQQSASRFFSVIRKPWYVAPGETTPVDPDWPKANGTPVKALVSDTLARTTYLLDPYPDSPYALAMVSESWGADASKLHAAQLYIPSQIPYASPSNPGIAENELYAQSFDGYSQPANLTAPFRFADRLRENMDSSLMSALAWELEPLIHTGATLQGPGDHRNLTRLAFQYQMCADDTYLRETGQSTGSLPNAGLFLAGEGCSFLGGWAEGALTAGVNAAVAVLYSINRTALPSTVTSNWINAPSRYLRNGASVRPVQVASFHSIAAGAPWKLNYATVLPEKSAPLRLATPFIPGAGGRMTDSPPSSMVNWRGSTYIFTTSPGLELVALRLNNGVWTETKITEDFQVGGSLRAVVYNDVLYVFFRGHHPLIHDMYFLYLDTDPGNWQPSSFAPLEDMYGTYALAPVSTPWGLYIFSSGDIRTGVITHFKSTKYGNWVEWDVKEVSTAFDRLEAVECNGMLLVFFPAPESDPQQILYMVRTDDPHTPFSDPKSVSLKTGDKLRIGRGEFRAQMVDGNIALFYPGPEGKTVSVTFGYNTQLNELRQRSGPVPLEAVRADVQAPLAFLTGDFSEPSVSAPTE